MQLPRRLHRSPAEQPANGLLPSVNERERKPFVSVDDLARRVPELQKKDLVMLAQIGALNSISGSLPDSRTKPHRRDALWDVERVAQPEGPLLSELDEEDISSPLQQ